MEKTFTIGDNITVNRVFDRNISMTFSPDDRDMIGHKADQFVQLISDYYHLPVENKMSTFIISHVLNELIENAIKYSKNNNDSVKLETLKNNDKLLIRITNTVSADLWQDFINQCRKLFQDDLKTLFVNKIESLKKPDNNSTSAGIGLILLKKDFNTDIKFIFYEHSNENYSVSVIAELSLE